MEYYRPAPVPPDKKDQTLIRVFLAGCGCLLVITVLAVLLFGKLFFFGNAPVRVVRSHLEAINRQDFDLAYGHFTPEYRSSHSLYDFRMQLHPFYSFLPYRDASLNRISINNDRATVDGTVTGRDGIIFPVHYELVRKRGAWKIASFEWVSPGERQTI